MPNDTNFYRQQLPHFTPNDSPYFVTFRLANTLPTDLLRQKKLQSEAHTISFHEYDRLLDRAGTGDHWLKDPRMAKVVMDALHFHENKRYTLWAYTVMSNHVHLMFSPYEGERLWDVLRMIKSFTARQCNELLGKHGAFWQHESYDHVVRQNEFARTIFYILRNPVAAGLVQRIADWPYSYVNPELNGFDDTEYLQRE